MNNIFINTDLNNEEEKLISRNCHKKIIIVIYSKNEKSAMDLVIKEKKYWKNSSFTIDIENNEKSSSDYIKIDSKCPLWMQSKHYALLELDNVDEKTISFDILLKPNESSNEKTLNNFKMQIYEWHTDNGRNELKEWYILNGDEVYSLYDTINIGIFARVSDGWKFYPKLQKC